MNAKAKYYDKNAYSVICDFGDLAEGQTKAGQICPACDGGATKEGSLSVSKRDGVLLWNCHRASCPFKGSDAVSSGAEGERTIGQKASTVNVRTVPINQATIKFLATKFGVEPKVLDLAGLRWTGDGDDMYGRRVCFPIFGPDNRKRGENYRSYQGGRPKAIINLTQPDAIGQCWYKWKRASKHLVITEDQMSAIKVAPTYDAVALLGTNLSEAKINEIIDNSTYQTIYLCLDNDAIGDSIRLALKWRARVPNLQVIGLQKDIKDMNADELDEFMLRLI